MIFLNGEKLEQHPEKLEDLIKEKNYKLNNIAVILNEKVVKKNEWGKVVLKDGDKIDIVGFMGGG